LGFRVWGLGFRVWGFACSDALAPRKSPQSPSAESEAGEEEEAEEAAPPPPPWAAVPRRTRSSARARSAAGEGLPWGEAEVS